MILSHRAHHAPSIWPAVLLAALAIFGAGQTYGIQIASKGRVRLPIVVSPTASERTRAAAAELADYLGRISGAPFAVTAGDGSSGIAVGLSSDFPALHLKESWENGDSTRREDYLLRSTATGVLIVGSADLAVEDGVWDLLYRLGYRQFFPGKDWEIIPRTDNLEIDVDTHQHPDYLARRIWYGFGLWDYNAQPYADWCAKNRATAGIDLRMAHSYEKIIARNKEAFDAHPEYLGLVDGVRKSTKFCISNPGLRKLVIQDALRQFEENPSLDSTSIEPSDGGDWCECKNCAKLGSVSDRAVLLANEVADAVNQKFPGKFVGMLAYNEHSAPPDIDVHSNVVISVATAFNKSGLSLNEVIAGWAAKGARLGIYDYYSVNQWDRDLPGAARGGNIEYLHDSIPTFYAKGARFMSAESSDNWGPNGLGYYLASRMLWEVQQAKHIDELENDFLERAFGAAKEPMREFYHLLDGSQPDPAAMEARAMAEGGRMGALLYRLLNTTVRPSPKTKGKDTLAGLATDERIGRMFHALDQARHMAETPQVRARVDDLVLYARYVDLFHRYKEARGEERQQAFEKLIEHAYRMRRTMLVHTKALYESLAKSDKSISIPYDSTWDVAEGKNPWKSSGSFTSQEISSYIAEGLRHYPLSASKAVPDSI